MRLLIFCLCVTSALALKLHNKHADPCADKECRAGRECVEVEGEARCMCVISCPDHFKPVCGSDGTSYDNHCRLHQEACISGNPISIKHKGNCKLSHDKIWKNKDEKKSLLSKDDLEDELQNDLIDGLKKNEKKITHIQKGPAVCYSPQRNALRFLIVGYFEDELVNQTWHLEGMTYRESMWGWFYSCDTSNDKFVTSEELLNCAKRVNFFARPGQDNELTKELCIDALLDDGDKNRDMMLDFEEFTRIMDPKYQPKEKKCSLNGKHYVDGEEVFVDCNHCVCAVGNWICATVDCKHKGHKKPKLPDTSAHDGEIDNDIDVPVEDSNDVVDHVEVADLWMENNRKDKEKGKKAKEEKKKEEFDVDDNLFVDFDEDEEEEEMTPVKDNTKKDEEKELEMDEYYDDLYEKTKIKNNNKKKHQLEKALKEIKTLRMKTESLKKLLKHQKELDKKEKHKDTVKDKDSEEITVEKQHLPQKHLQKKKDAKSKKYYDEVFKNTKWNDLINWGDMNYLQKEKEFDLQNNL